LTILEEIANYARLCIADTRISEYEDYLSCRAHKWACMRLLADIERSKSEDCPFYWDEGEAGKIVEWFALLRHSKGVLAGEPIRLTSWQKFRICQLYGWRRKADGRRRFRKTFTQVARKNAKSQEEAGIGLYEISVTSARNGEIAEGYTAGTKRDQSKIVFNEAALMLRGSPLQTKFRCTRDQIRHVRSGSFIKPLSKEDGKTGDGTNPAYLCLDEYHQHKTTEFYDLGLGGNTKEPLLQIITTAGMDLTYPCYTTEYDYCKKLLNPDLPMVENDEYLVDILELDPEDYKDIDGIANERLWWKANPIRMSYPDGVAKIRGDYRIAIEQTEHMTAFLTKCLDIWVQATENGYMNMAKWSACLADPKDLPDTRGWPVYVGFDMSAKIDLTSVAFVLPYLEDGAKHYILYSHSFIPSRERLSEHKAKDHQPYDDWERRGFITVTDTPIVDQKAVMRYVLDTCEANGWNVQCLCFDPANASLMMMELSDEGYDVEEVFQSHKSLNESTQGFREQVLCGHVRYVENPVLTFAMANATVRRNNGLIKIDKDMDKKRIDPVDATLCAYKLAMYHEFGSDFGDDIDAYLEGEE
jgi:phage terminase large subunit-like protein